jgi:hypothetical protein
MNAFHIDFLLFMIPPKAGVIFDEARPSIFSRHELQTKASASGRPESGALPKFLIEFAR